MAKNIIILLDGTGNKFGNNLTNIAKFARICTYDSRQIVYYQPGVGTVSLFNQVFTNIIAVMFGLAFGYGVVKNVLKAYTYLMDVYEIGDKVYILGFSRGAYESRALAGVLHKVGLLRKGTYQMLPYIAQQYFYNKNKDEVNNFKEALCQPCVPYFLGLFDTVGSRGYLTSKVFSFDSDVHPDIPYVYHALAIDEKRYKFQPLLIPYPPAQPDKQVLEEVWFPGCHCDVGGYYTDDDGLSNIAFEWMIGKFNYHDGLINFDKLAKYWPISNPNGVLHESYKGFWKLQKPYIRCIPEGANIHQSVKDRRNYKPVNLPNKYDVVTQ